MPSIQTLDGFEENEETSFSGMLCVEKNPYLVSDIFARAMLPGFKFNSAESNIIILDSLKKDLGGVISGAVIAP